MNDTTTHTHKHPTRGFASMSLEQRRATAAKGGAAVAPHKRSFAQDRDLAARAGAKGGASRRSAAR
jgi:general stress protein YciG